MESPAKGSMSVFLTSWSICIIYHTAVIAVNLVKVMVMVIVMVIVIGVEVLLMVALDLYL